MSKSRELAIRHEFDNQYPEPRFITFKLKEDGTVLCISNHGYPITFDDIIKQTSVHDLVQEEELLLAKKNWYTSSKTLNNTRHNELQAKRDAYKEHADNLMYVLEHAVEMGQYTPNGSTENWAKNTIKDYKEFKKGLKNG